MACGYRKEKGGTRKKRVTAEVFRLTATRARKKERAQTRPALRGGKRKETTHVKAEDEIGVLLLERDVCGEPLFRRIVRHLFRERLGGWAVRAV